MRTGRGLHPPDDEPYRRGVRLTLEGGISGLGHIGVKDWTDVRVGVCELMQERYPDVFRRVVDKNPKWFLEADAQYRRQIGKTGIYVPSGGDRSHIKKVCVDMLAEFGYSEESLEIKESNPNTTFHAGVTNSRGADQTRPISQIKESVGLLPLDYQSYYHADEPDDYAAYYTNRCEEQPVNPLNESGKTGVDLVESGVSLV